jgi:hypothetical protein
VTALLLAACTTPTEGLFTTEGFGHFNAKSIDFSLGGDSGLRSSELMQIIDLTTNALPVTATGAAAGIGKDDFYEVEVVASGTPTVLCVNGGLNLPPGQNPVDVTLAGSGSLDQTGGTGKYLFTATTGNLSESDIEAILTPFPCQNRNWTASVDWIDWQSATVNLYLLDGPDGQRVDPENPVDTEIFECTTLRSDPANAGDPSISCKLIN